MELGETLFLCVFLIPFVTIGLGMLGAAFLNLLGIVEVIIDGASSSVATGVGFVKWKRHFDALQVRSVKYGTTPWQSEGSSNKLIEMIADRTIKFGSGLPSDRMEWLQAVLRSRLLKSGKQVSR